MLTSMEAPKYDLGEFVTPSTHHPLGARGVAESPTVGSPVAVVNAVGRRALALRGAAHRHAAHAGQDLADTPGERDRGLSVSDSLEPNTIARRAELLEREAELARAERPFAVVTVVRPESSTSARAGNRAIVLPDGSMEGWVGGGCIRSTARREGISALESGEPRFVRITPDTGTDRPNVRVARMTCASEGTADLYVEPFLPRPTLVVAGESPVAATLAAIASPLGFRFVRLETGTGLDEEKVPYPRDAWMVVATFGEYDGEAIEAGLELGLPYIGLVASGRRAGSAPSELRARGYTEEALKVVRSPAGLPIRVGGQEGISLSVMAEVLSLRSERDSEPGESDARAGETLDPVCGMTVEMSTARYTSEHGSRTYYFCCPACKRAFDGSPEEYASRISA